MILRGRWEAGMMGRRESLRVDWGRLLLLGELLLCAWGDEGKITRVFTDVLGVGIRIHLLVRELFFV
jgi:hypothetical protein